MQKFRRFVTFFNIQPGEERLIGLLVLLYFLLALGFVFVESMAFGIFLTEYGIGGLPYSYISIAVLASLAAALYIRLGGRVSFSQLLSINLLFLTSASLLIWLGLNSRLYHLTGFILPLWFQIAINLGSLAVWSLATQLINVRQGKRLFPILSGGRWLANILGGLFIFVLVKFMSPMHLLFLAGWSFGAAFFLLRFITRSYLQRPPEMSQTQRTAGPAKTSTNLFKNRYVLLIFAYTLLWWVAFFFVENIFYNRAFAQYPDANQLTAIVGRLLSMIGIVALISSSVLSSRIIARFGLRAGLLLMPMAVILGLGVVAVSGSLGAPLFFVFALSALTKVMNVAFGFSLSLSANAIVYQSLPDTIRGRVLATAEGVVQPIAVGLAGTSLLLLTDGLKFNYVGIAYVFVGLGVLWLVVILSLSGNYVRALTQVITKRRLGEDASILIDPASIALLKERLHDSHAGIVIFALTKLEALDPQAMISELPSLLQHPAAEVRREAFQRVESLRLRTALEAVQTQYAAEQVPPVKERALRALGAIAKDPSPLLDALHTTDIHSLRGALIGLLKYRNNPAAEQKLNRLLASPSAAERNLAIEVIGEVNRREWDPHLIRACDSLETSRLAGLALASVGEEALPAIESAFSEPDAPQQRLSTLARVLGRIGGTRSQMILSSRISAPNHELRSQVLHALSQSGYRATDISVVEPLLRVEAEQSAWVSAAQLDLGETEETKLLWAALKQFHEQIRSRALLLSSFALDGDSIRRVREAFLAGSGNEVSYAIEIVDAQLPTGWKKMLMPLLEDLAPEERIRRYGALLPQTKQSPAERLQEIMNNECLPYWLRACAVHAARDAHQGDQAMASTVEKVLILKSVSMFSQTPDHVLAEVADLLEEVEAAENQTIFKQGEPGDSLYVILHGRVRVHDGERLLNYLGERDVFGEMALLDPEPRLASVTALEPTRLFRLGQAPFYALMEERPEVSTGILRVLTRHLRNRVHDIAGLNARLQELESRKPA